MQNEELIQSLRSDAEWAHANEWETPITLGDNLDAAAGRLEAADKRVKELTARAEAAEAERDAAVEDWKAYEENGQCDVCKCGEGGGCVYPEGGRCHFEWRGQEAGKEKGNEID